MPAPATLSVPDSPADPQVVTRRGALQLGGAATLAALFTNACSGAGQSSAAGKVLTVGQLLKPNSLDPVKANGALQMYVWPAYDPLIYRAPDGRLQPRLATSWRYIGSGNKTFELKLRRGVTFSDGSPLTAAVVKANLEYAKRAGAEVSPRLASIEAIEAVDDLTVRLALSTPFPLLPDLFTQAFQSGNVISGEALKQPGKLANQSFGAGPYVLDTGATVAGDHYTYTPNPRYWDKAAVRYDKLVIKVLPNPNTALAALRTGQADVIEGDATTADAAKKAGLRIGHAPISFQGLAFADRTGALLPALGDVRVRQAINYALDREKITRGLFAASFGTPAQQIVAPGMDGYNDRTFYTYDPDRAKRLLAEAGHAGGFTLPVLSIAPFDLLAQAMTEDLAKIGVRVRLTSRTDPTAYTKDLGGGTYPAFAIGYGMAPIALMGQGLFLPNAALFNPRKSADRQISDWYDRALGADEATREELDKKIVARLAEQAWFAPVSYISQLVYSRPTVSKVGLTVDRPYAYPADWAPAGS